MENMEKIKEMLENCVFTELAKGLENVDAKELYYVIDCIKDCAEAMYYCKITEAMDEAGEEDKRYYNNRHYMNGRYAPKGAGRVVRGYTEPYYEDMMYDEPMRRYSDNSVNMRHYKERDMDRDEGRMYYTEMSHGKRYFDDAIEKYKKVKEQYPNDTSEHKKKRMEASKEMFDEFGAVIKEMFKDSPTDEKQDSRNKLSHIANAI